MASFENNDVGLVEMDLEVSEIDGALLRELLEEEEEEEEGKDGNDHGNLECMVESLEENNIDPDIIVKEKEQWQHNCLEQYECHSGYDFEWLNMMEPTNPLNEVMMNCFSDDIVGMVDFDY